VDEDDFTERLLTNDFFLAAEVQYKVVDSKVKSAYYKLTDPVAQIRSYVFDVIRSSLPRMDLDDAFASKSDLAEAVKNQLQTLMADFGYEILAALVVDLNPDKAVKDAMNGINGTNFTSFPTQDFADLELPTSHWLCPNFSL
jgi:regulator of protease activity HflC (stomatin/prohibitin superfamily)